MTRSGPCPRCGAIYSTTCGQGSGIFIYGNHFEKRPDNFSYSYDGIFDAFDIISEALKSENGGYWNYKKTSEPFLVDVDICMACGFIYGECTDEQATIWGISKMNDYKRFDAENNGDKQ